MSRTIDAISGLPIRLSHDVAEIHAGNLFAGSKDFDAASGVLLIKTAATNYAHIMYGVESQDAGVLEFFEAPTVTVDGTALTFLNHKRTNAGVPGAVLTHTPTTTANGLALPSNTIGSGGAIPFRAGGASDIANKYILEQDTYYMIKFTPAAAAKFTLFVDIHETDGNRDE